MKSKKLILIISSLMVAVLMIIQPVLAWLYFYRTDVLLVTGDVRIEVEGWCQVANDDSQLEYKTALQSVNVFSFRDVTMDNFIAFKFRVTNKNQKSALLSSRFSDFSEYIFEHFPKFYQLRKAGQEIGEPLATDIYRSAEMNTAKLATILDDVYYIDIDGSRVELSNKVGAMWQYGYGQKVFEDILLPGVTTDPDAGTSTESEVELYFIVRSNHSSGSTEEYLKWLCGYTDTDGSAVVGYGQRRIAALLGYSWEALPAADKTIANEYLDYFIMSEFRSISTVGDDGLSLINLNIRYFEFIGDNARP